MRLLARTRLIWFLIGLSVGCLFSLLHAAWNVWPFQEDVILHWVRWIGKETVKWGYIAVIFAIIAFIVMQLLNVFVATRVIERDDQSHR